MSHTNVVMLSMSTKCFTHVVSNEFGCQVGFPSFHGLPINAFKRSRVRSDAGILSIGVLLHQSRLTSASRSAAAAKCMKAAATTARPATIGDSN